MQRPFARYTVHGAPIVCLFLLQALPWPRTSATCPRRAANVALQLFPEQQRLCMSSGIDQCLMRQLQLSWRGFGGCHQGSLGAAAELQDCGPNSLKLSCRNVVQRWLPWGLEQLKLSCSARHLRPWWIWLNSLVQVQNSLKPAEPPLTRQAMHALLRSSGCCSW